MIVLLTVSLLATFLTFLEGKGKLRNGMLYGFVILMVVISVRDHYGNDFENYLDWFNDILKSNAGPSKILSKDFLYGRDNGWSFLYYLFSPFSFNAFVAFTSIFSSMVFYHFIKNNVQKGRRWLAVFIYLFTFQIFVLDLSMMRHAFAISLFIIAYKYISNGKLLIPFLIILVAMTIHSSAIILFPFLFISKIRYKNNKILACILASIYVLCIPLAKYSANILSQLSLISSLENFTETYVNHEQELSVGIGYIVMHIPFVLYIFYLWNNLVSPKMGGAIVMSCIPFFLLAFKEIPMLDRLGYYFVVFSIIALPLVFSSIRMRLRIPLLMAYILVTMHSYFNFFTSPIWSDKFLVYRTIFG